MYTNDIFNISARGTLPVWKLDSFERLVHKLSLESNFQSGKVPRAEPQPKKHENLLFFVEKCNNFATFSKEICLSWYIETSYNRKYWFLGKILQIFQKKFFQFWHFETQYFKKYWLFEQNSCRLALVMPFRVSLSKKVNFSFWRVLVTVQDLGTPWKIFGQKTVNYVV